MHAARLASFRKDRGFLRIPTAAHVESPARWFWISRPPVSPRAFPQRQQSGRALAVNKNAPHSCRQSGRARRWRPRLHRRCLNAPRGKPLQLSCLGMPLRPATAATRLRRGRLSTQRAFLRDSRRAGALANWLFRARARFYKVSTLRNKMCKEPACRFSDPNSSGWGDSWRPACAENCVRRVGGAGRGIRRPRRVRGLGQGAWVTKNRSQHSEGHCKGHRCRRHH